MMFYTDHSVVVCKLNCLKPPPSKVLVNYQAITVIFTLISSALIYWTLSNNLLIQKDLHVSVEDYNTALNIHRLFYSLSTIDRERLGLVAKREKRRLDKMFRKSHLTVHRQLFMLDSVKSDYFKAKIDQVGNHRLFKTIIDCSPQDHRFYHATIYDSLDSLSENFNYSYVPRIRNLRSELEGISKYHAIPVANDSVRCSHLFSKFDSLMCLKGYFMLKISHHKLIFAYMTVHGIYLHF